VIGPAAEPTGAVAASVVSASSFAGMRGAGADE